MVVMGLCVYEAGIENGWMDGIREANFRVSFPLMTGCLALTQVSSCCAPQT